MKALVAVLGLVWAIVNLVIAYYFLADAFLAKTAIKEGILAQASLLLGGALMAIFAVLLARVCLGLMRGRSAA